MTASIPLQHFSEGAFAAPPIGQLIYYTTKNLSSQGGKTEASDKKFSTFLCRSTKAFHSSPHRIILISKKIEINVKITLFSENVLYMSGFLV
ncbi:MAG: hypothetical protein IJ071_12710 [Ruminococcus sp.]|nr:hypothetical protein [Ruminococcus sp.]